MLLACFVLCLQQSLLFSCGNISLFLFILKQIQFPFFWKNFQGLVHSNSKPSLDEVASLRNVITVMFIAFLPFTVTLNGINYCKGVTLIISKLPIQALSSPAPTSEFSVGTKAVFSSSGRGNTEHRAPRVSGAAFPPGSAIRALLTSLYCSSPARRGGARSSLP